MGRYTDSFNTLGGWGIVPVKQRGGMKGFKAIKIKTAKQLSLAQLTVKVDDGKTINISARPAMKVGFGKYYTKVTNTAVETCRKRVGKNKVYLSNKHDPSISPAVAMKETRSSLNPSM